MFKNIICLKFLNIDIGKNEIVMRNMEEIFIMFFLLF